MWLSDQRLASVIVRVSATLDDLLINQQDIISTIIAHPSAAPGLMNTTEFEEAIYADAPRGVLIPGTDPFILKIYANAGRYTLFQWGLSLAYAKSALTFVSITSPAEIFSDPRATVDTATGTIVANTISTATAHPSLREGSSIHIATIHFSIQSTVNPGLISDVVTNLRALYLVNVNGNQFVTNGMANVYDAIGKHRGTVSMRIAPRPIAIGMYASPSLPYVIASPNGVSSSVAISSVFVNSNFGSTNTILDAFSVSCNSSSSPTRTTCANWVGQWNAPIREEAINATSSTFSVPISLRTYAHTSIRIAIDMQSVPLIAGETRRYRIFVIWGGDPDGNSPEVEVTGTRYSVTAVINNTLEAIIMQDGLVRASPLSGVGIANVSLYIAHPTNPTRIIASTTFRVDRSSSLSSVTATLVYIQSLSDTQWPRDTTPILMAGQSLSQEGQSHTILAVGATRTFVQLSSLTSAYPATYSVRPSSQDGYAWLGEIPGDAKRVSCELMLLSGVSLSPIYTVIPRTLDLPIPDISSLQLCCSDTVILSPDGDALISVGYSSRSYSRLVATVTYADGKEKIVTSDARTSYSLVNNTCGAVLGSGTGNIVSVASQGSVSVRAVFGGYAAISTFTCAVTIGIVPSVVLLGGGQTTSIQRVNCASNVFQSVR